jgi:hypothetical protein
LIGVKAIAGSWIAAAALALAGCQPAVAPTGPAGPVPGPLVVPAPRPADVSPLAPAATPPVALPAMDLPPGPIYHCEVAGSRDVLLLPENIESLCRRHPEMGPCQYERDACRQRGGRVLTSKGDEVTRMVEAEYDKRVRRVRFQADVTPQR